MSNFRIKEGKRYRTRKGYITQPLEKFVVHQMTKHGTAKITYFTAEIDDAKNHPSGKPSKPIWQGDNGSYLAKGIESRLDLIEEYIENKD